MLKNLKEFSLPAVEEKVLAYWRANDVFEKSLEKRKPAFAKASVGRRKKFVFFEGPPTANGRPGIHHVLARAFKDIIPRYKTMRGFHVPRRGGWDTHGLPVEIEVEKALGLKSKKEIEKFGIAAFNAQCKQSVWKYKDEWEKLTERMGFWLDMKHPYITYENRYMEAVWGVLSQIAKRKLLYRGYKVVPWCPRCGTGLSSHELALGYETVEDTSVYVKFKVRKGQRIGKFTADDKTYILSWTTTPWTLPGNVALAVGEKIDYSLVKSGEDSYVVATNLREKLFPYDKETDIRGGFVGKALVDVEYEPLFDVPSLKSKTSYKVYLANFVTTEDGTGVVHTAVMYGEDDYQLGMKVGLPARHTVDEAGKFTKDVKGFAGMFVKAAGTEKKILDYLSSRHLLFASLPYKHEYPFCWRCKTPLLYYARDSWFIAMSKLRAKLLSENKKINWVPTHLRDGRFGEWLREVKDWAISRARYWGTPLPIWQCDKCDHVEVLGSMEEVQERAGGRNTVIFVRHGEADHNVRGLCGTWVDTKEFTSHLTKKGEAAVRRTALALKKVKPDYIVTSNLARAKETGKILQGVLGGTLTVEPELRDMSAGRVTGKPVADFYKLFSGEHEMFDKNPHGGETWNDVRARMWKAFRAIDARYNGKTIIVVSHGDPLWILKGMLEGASDTEQLSLAYPETGERYDVRTGVLPRDGEGRVDLHRPYVDDVTFGCVKCADGKAVEHPRRSRDKKVGTMKRIPEVLDVWFDSGAMPFAQNTNRHEFSTNRHEYGIDYPADYISEGVDQTRGWFYTLLAIGVLMGKGRSYKNVISLGLVLDKNGQKMSKSKGNAVDPWAMIQKYGIDAVRWYFYTVNPPGESKKFDEADIGKTLRQFLMMVYNSWLFYETYADKTANSKGQIAKSGNVLDKWITARLEETKDIATKALEQYEVGDAARTIEMFAGDLSRWYIRRSRRRLQKSDPSADGQKDYHAASATLGYALTELSKLMAPFAPFFAEALYLSLVPNKKGVVESVHFEEWPTINRKLITNNSKLITAMEEVREFASAGLAIRAEKGIKVRQPLASLKLKTNNPQLKTNKELLAILADEVNVKKVIVDAKLKEELVLDTSITHELLEDGWFRELVRTVQGMRQDAKLTPKDIIAVHCEVPPELTHVIRSREKEFMREVNAKSVEFGRVHKHNVELQTKIGDWPAWLAVKKER